MIAYRATIQVENPKVTLVETHEFPGMNEPGPLTAVRTAINGSLAQRYGAIGAEIQTLERVDPISR